MRRRLGLFMLPALVVAAITSQPVRAQFANPYGFGGRTATPAAGPVPLQPINGRYCHALAPSGWSIADQDDRGATFTLASPDGQMKASYGVLGINSGQVQGFYGPQFRTPALLSQFLASVVAGRQLQASAPQNFMGMQVINFGGGAPGFAIYRTYPLPADPGGYILSVRIATATSPRNAGIAGSVAASINCSTELRPPAGGYAQVKAKSSDVGTSSKCKAGNCDDGDFAGTYNAQLGTGWVHDGAGNNYNVSVTDDYDAQGHNGEGPGYYKHNGNDWIKLQPGLE